MDQGRVSSRGDPTLKRFLELSSEWYWEQDDQYRFSKITGDAIGKIGLEAQSCLGMTLWDHGGSPAGEKNQWDEHKALLSARQPFIDFLYRCPNERGELCVISMSGEPVFDDREQFQGYRGIARDVTDRINAELQRTIEHKVTHILAETEHIIEAGPQILQPFAICLNGPVAVVGNSMSKKTLFAALIPGVATTKKSLLLMTTKRTWAFSRDILKPGISAVIWQ